MTNLSTRVLGLVFCFLSLGFFAQDYLYKSDEVGGPIMLLNGSVTGVSPGSIDPQTIESISVYKKDSDLPSALIALKNHLNRGLISITLKKAIETEHPVDMQALIKLSKLPSQALVQIDGIQLYSTDLSIFPSAIKELSPTGSSSNPMLSIKLGKLSKEKSSLILPSNALPILKEKKRPGYYKSAE